jgi:hypothetical protein
MRFKEVQFMTIALIGALEKTAIIRLGAKDGDFHGDSSGLNFVMHNFVSRKGAKSQRPESILCDFCDPIRES